MNTTDSETYFWRTSWWADGADLSAGRGADQVTYTVSGGQIALGESVTNAIVGLPYSATFKSAKLAYAAAGGTALTQKKKVDHLGLIMAHTHYQGLYYGDDENSLWPLPLVEDASTTAADTVVLR